MCFFLFYVFFSDIYHWFLLGFTIGFPRCWLWAVWATVTPSLNFAGAVSRWQAIGSMGKKIC